MPGPGITCLRGCLSCCSTIAAVKVNSRVESVDTENKSVTAGGEKYEYDKLLLATGSRPKIPGDIKGTDSDGVFTLRFFSDASGMASRR